jgi:signal transduction histidine kinase
MADNKDLRDGRDRERVAGHEEYEVNFLAQKLNVSAEEVRRAIEQVGNNREKLEEYLRRGNR